MQLKGSPCQRVIVAEFILRILQVSHSGRDGQWISSRLREELVMACVPATKKGAIGLAV